MVSHSEKRSTKRKGFQCKQFFVAHDQCAMKVGTDSLILGSWCDVSDSRRILDIGSGSGILSLMMAQKSQAQSMVMGIDINAMAVAQANDNAECSPWPDKLAFLEADVTVFRPNALFDCIISNPPYFELSQSASIHMTASRREARQVGSLSLEQLVQTADKLLSADGRFYLIVPYSAASRVEASAQLFDLRCYSRLSIRSTEQAEVIRQCMCFGYGKPTEILDNALIIYDENGSYTDHYRALCRDFYLAF